MIIIIVITVVKVIKRLGMRIITMIMIIGITMTVITRNRSNIQSNYDHFYMVIVTMVIITRIKVQTSAYDHISNFKIHKSATYFLQFNFPADP